MAYKMTHDAVLENVSIHFLSVGRSVYKEFKWSDNQIIHRGSFYYIGFKASGPRNPTISVAGNFRYDT